ncbi:HNH endonuclease [Nocardia sp. NPDC049149]|uniref:HNH endonuclease n=1 Tax=Nocardia sp. NPDC049149 TaxID=3364315 RepID=UPI0037120643
MPGSTAQRNTTTRDRHRNRIRRGQPPCGICGLDIDYTLPHLDPGEFVVDHIIPLAKGGSDSLDNCQAAHRACNRLKSDTLDSDPAGQTEQARPAGPRIFITSRTW